jgi:hypothetical protein
MSLSDKKKNIGTKPAKYKRKPLFLVFNTTVFCKASQHQSAKPFCYLQNIKRVHQNSDSLNFFILVVQLPPMLGVRCF